MLEIVFLALIPTVFALERGGPGGPLCLLLREELRPVLEILLVSTLLFPLDMVVHLDRVVLTLVIGPLVPVAVESDRLVSQDGLLG